MKRHQLATVALGLVCLAMVGVAYAEDADPLFRDTTTLDVTLAAPLDTLVRTRPQDTYIRGEMTFPQADGSEIRYKVKVRTRGNFRHKNCVFPPFMLNFRKSEVKGTLLDKQKKLKLVVHCDRSELYEQAVLREYIAYRLLNLLTDQSFRVRLLRIRYVDSDGVREEQVRYAFLLEHKKRLAKRIEQPEVYIEKSAVDLMHPGLLNLTSVFQYFIGNTDFSPVAGPPGEGCCHNYVLFGDETSITPIPYDFDHAGIVDAPYAKPNARFRLKSVRQRLYRGRCANNEHLDASLQRFQDHRDEIYALVDEQEGFTAVTRRQVRSYVDGFFKVIDKPSNVKRRLVDRCI